MHRCIPLMVFVIGCRSGTGSASSALQGVGSFVPNAVLAERFPLHDGGGILQGFAEILVEQTTPMDTCALVDVRPDGGLIVAGQLLITIDNETPIQTGSYAIVTQSTFFAEENHPDGGIAFVQLFQPTKPPSSLGLGIETSLSGNLKLTSVGNEWAGSFSTILQFFDGGQAEFSGTFDTTSTCTAQ